VLRNCLASGRTIINAVRCHLAKRIVSILIRQGLCHDHAAGGIKPQDAICATCGAAAVSERPERTARGYRRFRCRTCGKQFNERSAVVLNRAQYPSDVIALVVLRRLRYKLALRDLPEMLLVRGIVFSHEAVRDWEAELTPALAENLRRRRQGKARQAGGFCCNVWSLSRVICDKGSAHFSSGNFE
jgi:hypothetical protein